MNENKPAISNRDRVLISFYRLTSGQADRAPYEELVLQAWREFPEQFSLRNHPEYPDASDIHKRLSELARDGFVIRLGNKNFRLTDKGIHHVCSLSAYDSTSKWTENEKEADRLGRTEIAFIDQARRSTAFSEWIAGKSAGLVDHDARTFFQISAATPLDDRRKKVAFVRETLERSQRARIKDSKDLAMLFEFLLDRFGDLLGQEVRKS